MRELTPEEIKKLGDEIETHPIMPRRKHVLIGFACKCGKIFPYYNPDFISHLQVEVEVP